MPRMFSPVRSEGERIADEQRAFRLQRQLAGKVTGVAITFVDHSGAGRIKVVPLEALARAARFGVGFSPVVDAFTSDGGLLVSDSSLSREDRRAIFKAAAHRAWKPCVPQRLP